MSNLIQIKRSLTQAAPTSLANGELAYTANGNILYIGSNGSINAIGGLRSPGTLTANQALVANSSSGIDKVITANLVAYSITANGSSGTNGFVLSVNNGNTYWQDPNLLTTAAAGSNGQVQFNGGDNDFTVSNGFVFTIQSNNLTVSNTVISARLNIASNTFIVNTAGIYILSGTSIIANGVPGQSGEVLTSSGNSVFWASPVTTLDGLSDVSAAIASNNDLLVYNGTSSQWVNKAVGNGFSFADQRLSINNGNGLTSNSTGLHITPRTFALTGDVSGNASYDGTGNVSISVTIAADSVALGTDTTGDYVSTVTAGVGINVSAGTGEGSTPTISVVANTGVTANSSGIFIGQPVGNTAAVTFGDIDITGNAIFGSSFTDLIAINSLIASDLEPASNNVYSLGSVDRRWLELYAANVHAGKGYFTGSVQIGGDIIVTGNLVTQNVSSVIVSDPIIQLAANNNGDLLDIGFVGHYYNGAANVHTGLIRHAADDQYYLFESYLTNPGPNIIDVGNTASGFAITTLNAFVKGGGFTSNSSAVFIQANSTLSVSITANTIALSTPLAATSGGVGHNSFTLGDILVASNTSYISKLGVGTVGKVLQSNGSTVVYADLDGGTF